MGSLSTPRARAVPTPRVIFGTIAFMIAFYGGTPAFLAVALAVRAVDRGSDRARRLRATAGAWSRYHRACLRLAGIRVAVSGPPPAPGMLVAAKHQSFFEAIDLPYLLNNPAIFAKAELLRIPLWGSVGRAYGLIPVNREGGASALRAMLAEARASAAAGRRLAIFPEGTRVPPGAAPALKAGFAGLYKLLGAAVAPVAVDSGRCYGRVWKRPGTIHVAFGAPIPAGLSRTEIETRVQAAINALNPLT